jgi:hypothetical protein
MKAQNSKRQHSDPARLVAASLVVEGARVELPRVRAEREAAEERVRAERRAEEARKRAEVEARQVEQRRRLASRLRWGTPLIPFLSGIVVGHDVSSGGNANAGWIFFFMLIGGFLCGLLNAACADPRAPSRHSEFRTVIVWTVGGFLLFWPVGALGALIGLKA